MHFKDENAGEALSYNPLIDSTFTNTYTPIADLRTYLQRPVRIYTQSWTVANALRTSIKPWDLYFNDARIKDKIENYGFLQCNLKLKFVVNATPFNYGALLVSYNPLNQYEGAPVTTLVNYDIQCIGLSQRPHLWIYPATNQGGELVLPYINKEDWLDVTSRASFQNMGELIFITPDILRNANSVTNTIDIQVFAWAEDIRLAGPTLKAALQADEYEYDGVISKPASAISRAAGALGVLPKIGPFATATSMVTGAVAEVASWFGFTNTPVISEVKPYKSMNFHSLASAEISQPVDKLTLDPKNELTIDSRTIGLDGTDELVISSLAQRESFLKSSVWAATDAVDHVIFGSLVNPFLYAEQTNASVVYHQSTPLAWMSHMFKYWRGDLIFRFRFIATKYHKGRVMISWDPHKNLTSSIPTPTTNYCRIVDIAEEPDVEIRVNFCQETSYRIIDNDTSRTYYSDTGAISDPGEADNGCIVMRVLTQQTSPVTAASIQVLTSVRAADNFELANPKGLSQLYSLYTPQSEEIKYGDVQSIDIATGGTVESNDKLSLVYMGETMLSLRQLIRRSSLSRVDLFNADSTARICLMQSKRARFPLYPGFDPNGVDVANDVIGATTSPYNFVNQHPLNWVRMCFLGSRGSVIWHFNADSPVPVGNFMVSRSMTTRLATDYSNQETFNTTISNDEIVRSLSCIDINDTPAGASLVNQMTQTGLSVLAPMYSRFRMQSNAASENTLGNSRDDSDFDSLEVIATAFPVSDSKADPKYMLLFSYASAGTDYTPVFFLNVPTLTRLTSLPTAV